MNTTIPRQVLWAAVMLVLCVLALVLFSGKGCAEEDAFQQCAIRALRGDFGKLKPWQEEAYRLGLQRGVTVKGRVFLTAYYPWEGRSGRVDRRGKPCTLQTAAANRLPYGTYIWVANPCGVRQVLDCGASYNDRVADRRGCDLWIDLWMTRRMGTRVTDYAVIGKE